MSESSLRPIGATVMACTLCSAGAPPAVWPNHRRAGEAPALPPRSARRRVSRRARRGRRGLRLLVFLPAALHFVALLGRLVLEVLILRARRLALLGRELGPLLHPLF